MLPVTESVPTADGSYNTTNRFYTLSSHSDARVLFLPRLQLRLPLAQLCLLPSSTGVRRAASLCYLCLSFRLCQHWLDERVPFEYCECRDLSGSAVRCLAGGEALAARYNSHA